MPTTWGEAAKPCDSCITSPAILFCRADSAFLCAACDHHIHSANPLAHRHQRLPFFQTPSHLSAAPKSSPSSFQLVPAGILHHSSSEPILEDSWLFHNHQKKIDANDFLFSPDFDPFLDSGSTDFDMKQQVVDELCNHHSYEPSAADSVVPIQPRNNPLEDFTNERCFEIDFTKSKLSRFPIQFPAQCISQSVSSSDVGIVPDGNSNSISEASNFSFSNSTSTKGSSLDGGSTTQLSPSDRKARVLRYREKRKNRRFEKTIRYASRKAYAEIRPRIKGRFAKRTHVDADDDADDDAEVDMIYGSAPHGGIAGNFVLDDDMYGVVPSL